MEKAKAKLSSSKLDLAKVTFGKSAAEKEMDTLPNYFVSTRAYLNAKDSFRKKLFYIGHRGSGKSALFHQLAHEYKSSTKNIVLKISPEDYSYDTFKKLKHDFFDIRSAYIVAWHYTLLIQIMITVVEHFNVNRLYKKNKENLDKLTRFLKENNFLAKEGRLEILFFFLRRIKNAKVKIKVSDLEIESQGKQSNNEFLSLVNMTEIKAPFNCLKAILESNPVYMFIDELDTGWNNSKEAINFISGLISATIKLNATKGLNLYVSLRQDMYNNLSQVFRNTEKIRDDIELLKWDYKSLQALISQRIKNCSELKQSSHRLDYMSNEAVIGLIFEEGVFAHLVHHTLFRPREVIHFCSLALDNFVETYIQRRKFSSGVDMEAVIAVEQRFSLERMEDFCKEYEDELPAIKELIASFEGGNKVYTKDNFIGELEEILFDLLDLSDDLEWVKYYIERPNKFFEKLFNIGFVKICLNQGQDFFAYYERIPLNFRNVKFVQINNMFLPALQCV